jgi:hypothetical protein
LLRSVRGRRREVVGWLGVKQKEEEEEKTGRKKTRRRKKTFSYLEGSPTVAFEMAWYSAMTEEAMGKFLGSWRSVFLFFLEEAGAGRRRRGERRRRAVVAAATAAATRRATARGKKEKKAAVPATRPLFCHSVSKRKQRFELTLGRHLERREGGFCFGW